MDEQGLKLVARQAIRYDFNIQNEEVRSLVTKYKNKFLADKLEDEPLRHSDLKATNHRKFMRREWSRESKNPRMIWVYESREV